jgi:TolB-like protein/DNA-binding winged helix-turn-helix (wHTH) protein/Flp pilus assembly protein TadD
VPLGQPILQWIGDALLLEKISPQKSKEIKDFFGIILLRGVPYARNNTVFAACNHESAMQASAPPTRLRFGVFEIDLRVGKLTKRGARVRLQDQPFQVLAALIEKPGELVTREELRARIWPRTTVDFDHGLNKAISKIRDALGDSGDSPRFVETVPRRGYRFLAEVAPIEGPGAQSTAASEGAASVDPPAVARSTGLSRLRRAGTLAAVATAVVLAAAMTWVVHSRTDANTQIRSLAVLPLENLSGDAGQEYFVDGMTDELITRLGQISRLRVISRTSAMMYKGTHKPMPQIANELNVDAVVEGSVLRSGERVRITAQLIRLPDDKHIWSESYEGDIGDALALQNRVARTIAEQVRATLNRQEQAALQTSKTVRPEAYDAYFRGRYFWNKRTGDGLRKAIEYFTLAIEKDPNFAAAYSGLADAYALSGDWEYGILSPQEAFARSSAAAAKALALDEQLAEAHTSRAFALDLYAWEWEAAESEYRRALALNPGYATAHQWYAWHLMVMGRTAEGIAELRTAESLDPLSPILTADLADALCIAHLYDDSLRQSRTALELHPNFAVAHYQLGQTLVQMRKYDEAIAEFRKAIAFAGDNTTFDSNLAHAYAISGRTDDAMNILRDLEGRQTGESPTDASVALVYVGLGNKDQAMAWLEKAYQARFNPSILLRPAFDPIRADPRFRDLRARIGLPAN